MGSKAISHVEHRLLVHRDEGVLGLLPAKIAPRRFASHEAGCAAAGFAVLRYIAVSPLDIAAWPSAVAV
jgi:hypothetical protein